MLCSHLLLSALVDYACRLQIRCCTVGLVSNLSSSFTKWRNKDKHNVSAMSSCNEALAADCDWKINKESFMLDGHTVAGLTPRLRKRKAEDDAVAFSAGKR